MNIVIPEILSGGKGRDMQRSSRMIGDALAGIAQAGAKIYNQAGRIEAKQADNDLNVELSKLYGEAAEKTDGTNQKLADEVKTKADKKFNEYYGKISNSTAKELLKYSYESRIAAYTEGLNKHVADRLWQTTVEGVKIKVADSVRIAGQTGDLIGGADAIKQDLESQREYFGGRYDMVFRMAMSLYYSNAIPASLSNPQTRGATLAQLNDPHYKEKYYKHLDAEQIRAIEYHYGRAKQEAGEQQAFWDIGARYGNNYAAAYKYVLTPEAGKKYGLEINQQQNIAQSFAALANTQKETERAHDEETEKTLLGKALSGTLSLSHLENSSLSLNKKEHYAGIVKTPVTVDGFKTNPTVEAKIGDKIFSNPQGISDMEIALYVGRGLSAPDAEKLMKQREYFIKGKIPEHQKVQADVIFNSLKEDKEAGVFGDKAKGDIEYARKRSQFQRWLIQNPDKEPAQWYEEVVGPEQKGMIGKFLDWAAEVREKPLKRENTGKPTIPKGAQTGTYKGVRAYKDDNKYYSIETGEEIK